jgi:putative selenium metabolism hydrolase
VTTDLGFDAAITFARELIRIPSLPGHEGELAARVRQELERLPFDEVWTDDAGSVIGRARGNGAAAPIMLSCHLDAVDVGDPASWEHPPFAADLDESFLHGRGAMDIKGPLAIQTYAAARLIRAGAAGDVIVAHTVLEERGGLGMARLLESRSVDPGVVIIGEATAGDICIGHRGRAELIVELHGVAGHASAPGRASNPLDLLGATLEAISSFAAGLDADPLLGPATIAPTAIETLPRSRNVIPDRVRIVLDWRVLPGWGPQRIVPALDEHLRRHVAFRDPYGMTVAFARETQTTWTGFTRERDMLTPGYLIPPAHPVAVAAAGAAAEVLPRAPEIRPWTFATDGGHTCGVHHIPTIGFGPGEERFAHTNRERLDLQHARDVFEAYPAVIAAAQRAAAEGSVAGNPWRQP